MEPDRPVVVACRADWPQRAATLLGTLRERLGPVAERAEHIGSTSIPGMAAKDILDIQVSVADLDQAAVAFGAPLAALGFEAKPYHHDHVPAALAGDPERGDPELWVKRYWRRRGPAGDVNLHVRRTGSPNERLALLFRDWFRAHPEAVPAYAAFKTDLAAAVPGLDTYTDVKDRVVDLVIVAAEEWATATGWTP